MSLEWIITGVILLGGMVSAAVSLWMKRRRESQATSNSFFATSDLSNLKNNEK